MITNDTIKTFRDYNFVLTPVGMDKKPLTKNKQWFYDWNDTELLQADRIGAFHKKSKIYDVDFDDKSFRANQFIDLLPETLTIGKTVKGKIIPTHKIYRMPDDAEFKEYHYPKAAEKNQTIVETLAGTQTIIAGVDRVIINNVEPVVLDPKVLVPRLKAIVAFAELFKHMKNKANRNHFYFRLGGALTQTSMPMDQRIAFVERLCELTNDEEVKNRISCIERQQQKFMDNENVYSVNELSKFLGSNLPAFDEIKVVESNDDHNKIDHDKVIAFDDIETFLTTDYPKPEYIIEPYVSEQTIVQIVGASGVGKTMWGLTIAGAIASSNGLLDMTSNGKARPVLYIEGELPASDLQTRIWGMLKKLKRQCPKGYLNVSSLQQQLNQNDKGFTPIQTEQGLIEIENAIFKIKERTGLMPVVFIDNISCLAGGLKENDADAWSPIINKFVKWKNLGCTVFYFHHLNKGNDASGSTMQHRTIDMVIRMRKPDNKQKIKTFEDKGVQAIVDFPKWRLHDNSKYSQEHMLICESWDWKKLPVLTSDELEIVRMYDEDLSVAEMAKQISLAEKTIYKKIKHLKDNGVINEVSRQTADTDAKDIC